MVKLEVKKIKWPIIWGSNILLHLFTTSCPLLPVPNGVPPHHVGLALQRVWRLYRSSKGAIHLGQTFLPFANDDTRLRCQCEPHYMCWWDAMLWWAGARASLFVNSCALPAHFQIVRSTWKTCCREFGIYSSTPLHPKRGRSTLAWRHPCSWHMVLRILNVSLCQVVGGVVGLISEHLFSQRVCV